MSNANSETNTKKDIELLNSSLGGEYFGIAAYQAAIPKSKASSASTSPCRNSRASLESAMAISYACWPQDTKDRGPIADEPVSLVAWIGLPNLAISLVFPGYHQSTNNRERIESDLVPRRLAGHQPVEHVVV